MCRSHDLGTALEILSCLGQGCIAHQVLTILELASLLEEALGGGLRCDIRVGILVDGTAHLRQVIPIDLELGYAGLLGENVSVQTLNDGLGRWVLVELRAIILDIHVVADAEELLAVLVAAGEEDGGHADDVVDWQVAVIWRIALEDELHLSGLGAVHLDL